MTNFVATRLCLSMKEHARLPWRHPSLWRRDESRPIYRIPTHQPPHQFHNMQPALSAWEIGIAGTGEPDAINHVATGQDHLHLWERGWAGTGEPDAIKRVATEQGLLQRIDP